MWWFYSLLFIHKFGSHTPYTVPLLNAPHITCAKKKGNKWGPLASESKKKISKPSNGSSSNRTPHSASYAPDPVHSIESRSCYRKAMGIDVSSHLSLPTSSGRSRSNFFFLSITARETWFVILKVGRRAFSITETHRENSSSLLLPSSSSRKITTHEVGKQKR